MKKVLFATTALIATAGMAAADVRMSGYGRFGLDYNSANERVAGVSKTNITSRLRLQFDMSTETDSGVGFNARYRAQAESRDGVAGTGAFNGARFGVTYNGIAVNVGNIIGAVENAKGLYTTGTRSAGTGIDGMGFHSLVIKSRTGTAFNWDAYSSAGVGVNGIEVMYSAGGFTGHLSYSQRNGGAVLGSAGGEDRTGAMVTYSFGDYYVTAAMQSSSVAANDITFAAIGGDFGAFGAKLAYGSTDAADSMTLEGNMDIGAASNILVWVNSTEVSGVVTAADTADGTSFGINYQYDLGGGATIVAGYVDEADDDNQFQAGVYFSF
ncbi:porin [Phaeobacter sp. QD34_3]|uniref:porin n=1 Tax=unclassified Phaeobacter TaxID=2621772 RepID=UPI00237F3423|nr:MULTISPECIES: porin [unclassified Phaeobacter]MDE4132334.1 porin [Phaeobacter sp. QD34_3]MDE4135972.1 porin [Phaeobacter sp. QD34_24]MDE4173794.1 porin [Phaeobacter sp. PT47_59]